MDQQNPKSVEFSRCEVFAISPVDREDFIVEANYTEGGRRYELFELLRDEESVKIVFPCLQEGCESWQIRLEDFKRLLGRAESKWRDFDVPHEPIR